MMKKKVNADEVMRLIDKMGEINSLNLEEVEWVNDKGETLPVSEKILREWNFVGLNNKDFVDIVLFGNFVEETERVQKDRRVRLVSFNGTPVAPVDTDEKENYWSLIGKTGTIVFQTTGPTSLVQFDEKIENIECHNPDHENSLWIHRTDLEKI